MPRSQHLERCILGALARDLPSAEALKQLPHQALALYAHAAQGLVWNAVLSRRLKDFGPKPVVGDLVFAEPSDSSRCSGAVDADDTADLLMEDDDGVVEAPETHFSLPTVKQLKSSEEVA